MIMREAVKVALADVPYMMGTETVALWEVNDALPAKDLRRPRIDPQFQPLFGIS